ncbi:unnamed protein product [Fusarium venenatum]|uniref:Cation efflux protein transmembrane domain-containing protein n=1 Tax=Fusarium venenatum TaxID=56646 RepID=A0A2L2TH47_9HYPO|nr:uncharacterized protein FVRRES_06792 [Fusarium venenatum]KAH6993760.1 hypothetical protein EDB82DRAFT_176031 [Fusarium venenatum]CEI62356.1 unnamed protein product [Fusarium venenatum]
MDDRTLDEPAFSNIRVLLLGTSADFLRFILEWTICWNSKASLVTADNLHSSSDLTTSIITLLVILTTQHLYKTGTASWKLESFENFLSLFVATSRIGLALHTTCESMISLKFRSRREADGQILRNTHSETIWIAILTIFVKEWMHRKTLQAAEATDSALLTTVARHHCIDAIIGMTTVTSVFIGFFVSNTTWVNSAGGLVMSLLLLQSGIHDVVAACQVLHVHLSKRIRDD